MSPFYSEAKFKERLNSSKVSHSLQVPVLSIRFHNVSAVASAQLQVVSA